MIVGSGLDAVFFAHDRDDATILQEVRPPLILLP